MVCKRYAKSLSMKHSYQLLSLLFLLFAATPSAQAESVTLAWDPNSPAPDAYRLFQRTSGQSYDYSKWVYEGSETTCTIDNLAPGTTYYFIVRACSGGDQSGDSNEVSYEASYTTPAAPDTDPSADQNTDPQTDPNTDQNSGTDTIMVIDNGDSESSSTGSWSISGGKNPFGENSLYSRDAGDTYTFNSSLTGVIDVSLWWTEWSSRSTSVPVRIYDGNDLLDTVYVNQKENGGRWNLLGRYSFSHSARVTVVSEGSSSSTCADAAKFSMVTNDANPTSDPSPAPNPDADQNSGTDISMVIDNGDSESYSTGSWSISGGKNPFGENSLYSRDAGDTYTFNSSLTGVIDVSLWWTEWSSRSTSVPVRIYDGNDLLDTVYVDQKFDGGRWNLLGRYSFSHSARVTVVSEGSSSSTCADAAKFSMVTNDANPASDPSPAPNPYADQNSGTDISMVIDNGDSESYSTGTWKKSGSKNPFGDDSLYSRMAGATYTFESSLTGALDVSLWWTEWNSRCTSVPVHIYDGDEILDTVYVNQLEDGGQWNFLGNYNFNYSAEVVIVSESGACSTCADAVRVEQSK